MSNERLFIPTRRISRLYDHEIPLQLLSPHAQQLTLIAIRASIPISPPELMSHARRDRKCAVPLSDDFYDPVRLYTSSALRYTEEFSVRLVPVQACCSLAACEKRDGDFGA